MLFVSYGLYYFLPGSSYGFTIVINFALLYSSSEVIDNVRFPLHEVALLDVHARIGRQSQVESQVVDAGYLHGKQLLRLK